MTDLTIEELYELPIEKLNLPVKAFNSCLRTGITTVGDCVDFVSRIHSTDAMIIISSRYWDTVEEFENHILPALIREGYWQSEKSESSPDDFAPEVIEEIKQKLSEKGYLPQ